MRDGPGTRDASRPGNGQAPDDSTGNGREIVDDSPLVAGEPRATEPSRRLDEPGDVRAEPQVELWPGGSAEGLRNRWRELQLLFVDDPQAAVAGADAVLAETIETLTGALQAARTDLSGWRNTRESDTEGLRQAVQRYRSVLDRVLAL
jgi:hypothetical protein